MQLIMESRLIKISNDKIKKDKERYHIEIYTGSYHNKSHIRSQLFNIKIIRIHYLYMFNTNIVGDPTSTRDEAF